MPDNVTNELLFKTMQAMHVDIAVVKHTCDRIETRLNNVEQRFERMELRFNAMGYTVQGTSLATIEHKTRLDEIEDRIKALEDKLAAPIT